MSKRPAFQFYPGDWLRDGVAGCSLSAQGLWLRLMFVMHDSPRYGYLCFPTGDPIPSASAARLCGCSEQDFDALMTELKRAGVPSVTQNGIIYSRRMVRDEAERAKYRKEKKITRGNVRQMSGDCPPVSSIFDLQSSSSKSKATAEEPPPQFFFTGRVLRITADQHKRLCEVYGWVHPDPTYREADLWLEANPEKKRKNHYAFMRSWLSRAKEKAKPIQQEVLVGAGPEVATRYCSVCGNTGTWHLNAKKNGWPHDHEFSEQVAV